MDMPRELFRSFILRPDVKDVHNSHASPEIVSELQMNMCSTHE